MTRAHLPVHTVSLVLAMAVAQYGCTGEPEYCRHDPDCGGGIGGFCDRDDDCQDGFCCREESNCGGGICTYRCDRDQDCPDGMACEHDKCFFRCDADADCADGMSCEHGQTICEWP